MSKAELEDTSRNEGNHGLLYPNFNILANNEFLKTGEIDRRTNSYELSKAGEAWPPSTR